MTKKQALGRGLSALFDTEEGTTNEEFVFIPIENIVVSPYQSRKEFQEDQLKELAGSIREKGILQPLLVRIVLGNYELVAGERRLRASKMVGLEEVPCRVLELSNEEALEVGLLENIQRADLNCLEEAIGYLKLIEDFSYTQEMLAKKIGKSRSYIANSLRLLNLSSEIKSLLEQNKMTAGHARALLNAEDPVHLAHLIVSKGLNVRQTEALARKGKLPKEEKEFEKKQQEESLLIEQLEHLTGLKINISFKKTGGSLQFFFDNPSDLDQFLQNLTNLYRS